MNADLLPLEKVVTGHGGTGKWTRKKAFGFSRHVRSRPKATPMRMRYDPRKSAGKGRGRNKDNHYHFDRTGQGYARMQVRREASSCESASELLKTLTAHDAWEALGEQIYEELCAVSKGDADKSIYYSPATGWLLEDMCSDVAVYRHAAAATLAATRIQACWRGMLGREVYSAAKERKVQKERRAKREAAATRIQACWRGAVGYALGYILREEPENAAYKLQLKRALAVIKASETFDPVYAAAYSEQVARAKALVQHTNAAHKMQHTVTRIQACWRVYVAGNNYRAAKQAKAAASRDESANQLIFGSTILGHSIANDEPLYGGKCGCVALLTGIVPPCLGGSVTVFHDAAEAFYYVVWDYFERYLDKACDVRELHRAGGELFYKDISSLRQLLSLGPPYKPRGNVDLQTLLAERREPLGYTKSGKRLLPAQDLIFSVAAAVFMQCNLVLIDSAKALPYYVIVCCQRPNSHRQRSAHAQIRSDEAMVPWVRICQLVKGALGRKVLSLKITPGRKTQHVQGVRLSSAGERIIDGLLARLRDDRAELKLAADELAVVETMLEFGAPAEDSVGVLQMAGDDKKPIICSDCGKVHATRATVKSRPGGLVCVSDCGLLTEGRRKRPAECSEPPPPSKKRLQLAFSDEERPTYNRTYKHPSTADEVHPSGEPESAAMPPPAPQCASHNEPPALLVQCVSTEPSVPVPPSTLQPISDEVKDALFAKYGRIGPVASQSFASLDLPPIDDANAGIYQPPRLDVHRSAVARGPGSEPALWFKQVPPRPPSTHAAAHRLLTSLIFAVSLTDDRPRVAR